MTEIFDPELSPWLCCWRGCVGEGGGTNGYVWLW